MAPGDRACAMLILAVLKLDDFLSLRKRVDDLLLIDFAVTLRLYCFAQQRMKSGEYSLTVCVGQARSGSREDRENPLK